MVSVNTVSYCSVSMGNRVLYAYNVDGNHDMEALASLCLENTPQFHTWYFEKRGRKTFGYVVEDSFVYFAIVNGDLKSQSVLQLLESIRDEFKKFQRKSLRRNSSGLNSICIQEQVGPVINTLISSFECVPKSGNDHVGYILSPTDISGQAPLLGKPSKQEMRGAKDHIIAVRDIEKQDNRKSTERGVKVDFINVDSNNQGGGGGSSMMIRPCSQSIRRKWRRQVRIVLAVDAAVCVILFCIWLLICHGIDCIR